MSPMQPTDSIFLLGESREHPMHVGGLQLFELPDEAGPDYVYELYRSLVEQTDVRRLFRRRPRKPVNLLGAVSWQYDDDVDMEYHVRLSGLARPGRVRELLELTSRLHGTLLDRHRPLWEFHVIDGLADGRFATYIKLHHALMDGVSAMRLIDRIGSPDPASTAAIPPWASSRSLPGAVAPPPRDLIGSLRSAGGQLLGGARDAAGVPLALLKVARESVREQAAALPFQAPKSMLNVPITGARRFAAQSWPMERVKAVRRSLGGTVNDVVLAMCSGALRRYMLELDALPDRPLVAMVPVALRTGGSGSDEGGNAVGTILCNLATTDADPAVRYEKIRASITQGKATLSGLTPLQVLAVSGLVMAPLAAAPVPGVVELAPPPFNLIISNVPGPRRPLYWAGARLQGMYPLSVPYDGQALNITVTTYAGSLDFGLTGCRRSVPHLQRLLTHLEDTLAELEAL